MNAPRRTAAALIPAASYARISQKVERDKVADQHEQNERHAAARGYKIVARYTDDGISALGHKERPDFERMLRDVATAEWRVIVATEEERLARNIEEKLELHAACADAGAVWDTGRDGFVDPATDSGEFMSTIRAAVGRIESRRKARRQRAASDARAAEGMPTARPGYGYRRVDGRDVVEPAEAELIRDVADRILEGASLRSVAAKLNADGVASPRDVELARLGRASEKVTPWSTATLRQMLQRPSLAGLRVHRGEVTGAFDPELHPSILDEDTHARLVALFNAPERKRPTGGRTPRHLLSGIVRCGRCEGDVRMLRLAPWTPKEGQKSKPTKAAYACPVCTRVRRLQEPVDALVQEVILRRLERPDAVDLVTRGDATAATSARGAMAAIDARLATAADSFAEGEITGDQLKRITARLRVDRAEQERIVAAAVPARIPGALLGERAREVWAELHIDTKRAVIEELATITILPMGVGRSFDPNTVRIDWH